MLLGKVSGTVVATQKDHDLSGLKFLIVDCVGLDGKFTGNSVVCVDAVGSGAGEIVLFASGSSARQTELTKNLPVDHVIMAIVDRISIESGNVYDKNIGFFKS